MGRGDFTSSVLLAVLDCHDGKELGVLGGAGMLLVNDNWAVRLKASTSALFSVSLMGIAWC